MRTLLRQPEIIVGTWAAARTSKPGLTEGETRDALDQLEPLWDKLFPAEQARIVGLLVERVTVSSTGADIRLRVEGLASLVRDIGAGSTNFGGGGMSATQPDSLTVQVPLRIRRRPGRETVVTPEGASPVTSSPTISTRADPALVKALARAFRYQRMLDEGRYSSITEMAEAEKLDRGYMGRLLQLTLLAPEIVEAALDGHEFTPDSPRLMVPFPVIWDEQPTSLA